MTNARSPISRRSALALLSASIISKVEANEPEDVRSLDEFGNGVGSGDVTADMEAFARASAWLQTNRGGTLNFRKGAVYYVGRQHLNGTPTGKYSWLPDPVVRCDGATRPVVINGHGATIRAVSGLRYGTFNPVSGDALDTKAPYFGPYAERAVPYEGMVELTNCTGGITISNIELDGSNGSALLGGEFGDIGRQIPGSGLHLLDNAGPVSIVNVDSHHHCWDGMLFRHLANCKTLDRAEDQINIINFRATYNGRQGMSLTGGVNILLTNCRFAKSGKGAVRSAPTAGLDIEAEGGQIIRNVRCRECVFEDNFGVGLLAVAGGVKGLVFEHCTFVGTTTYGAWPNCPTMQFTDCMFVGSVNGVFATNDRPLDAATFVRCFFTDNRARSSSGVVFGSDGKGAAYLIDLGDGNPGAIFNDCRIDAIHEARMIYAKGFSTHFLDCKLSEKTNFGSWPGGTYHMTSFINSPRAHLNDVRLANAAVLYVNGHKIISDQSGKIMDSDRAWSSRHLVQ
jgi:Right handed beta helix region